MSKKEDLAKKIVAVARAKAKASVEAAKAKGVIDVEKAKVKAKKMTDVLKVKKPRRGGNSDEWGWVGNRFVHIEAEEKFTELLYKLMYDDAPDKYFRIVNTLTIEDCILLFKSSKSIGFVFTKNMGKQHGQIHELREALEEKILKKKGLEFLEKLKSEVSEANISAKLPENLKYAAISSHLQYPN
jgi:hypothetical protein